MEIEISKLIHLTVLVSNNNRKFLTFLMTGKQNSHLSTQFVQVKFSKLQ